ncbi:hypothetical protein KY347_03055 [Candidatus Woesearchaeota archaeon]|nr:hypothetical protein [Candidatus Woesearchaeota archaeon]
MKPVRKFEEFVKQGIAKKQSPDISRAKFLVEESEQNRDVLLGILKKVEVNDKNANSIIKLAYDVIMGLVRAKMLLEGYHSAGQGAHEAEVSYLRLVGFKEIDVQFVDQLRYFRNGMLYYGTVMDKEYAENVLEFLNDKYTLLKEIAKIRG